LIVIDASAVVEFLLGTAVGERVAARISSNQESLHVPHLLDVEVASALRRWVLQGRLPATRAQAALDDLRDVPLIRYPHDIVLPRIWELRANASAYDAAYLILGETLPAPVITCDARMAGIPGHDAIVEVMR
jgi:predicted nucleic acid-binding protein